MNRLHGLGIPRLLAISFASAILLGGLLLMLPACRTPGTPAIGWIDAFFTATSAVCVTGLVTLDTGSQFSFMGQIVILILIQLGGLGLITVSTLFIVTRSGRLSLSQRDLLAQTHGSLPHVNPRALMRQIIVYTFGLEAIGAALLTMRFAQDQELGAAVWSGVFHSVSAFCSAGFGLHPDSLMRYQDDFLVTYTVMALVVGGGIGFVVVADVWSTIMGRIRGIKDRLSLHSRVVLWFTGWLVFAGMVFFMVAEWGNVDSGESLWQRIMRMMFLSVATRTAGFNTVDTGLLRNATILVVMLLMAIGGSPGSTAGGIKTTTLGVLIALVRSRIRNRPNVELFNRSIPDEVVGKALATTAGFILTTMIAIVLLEWTESHYHGTLEMRGLFLEHLFEVVSALGTVGLSMGVTPTLSPVGKWIIIACMFLGRVGPLIVGASIIGRQETLEYKLPEESVSIG